MIDDLIDRLNYLCKKFVTDEKNFIEGDEIHKVFKEIKDLGYTVYSDSCNETSIVTDYLSDGGNVKYDKMLEYRQKKLEAVELKDFESAADYRAMEYQVERAVMLDYMRMADVAHFRILDRQKKEVICYRYCEMLQGLFEIE